MNDNDGKRELLCLLRYWDGMNDAQRWLIAVAVLINREMRQLADMRKEYAAYLIAALFLISITGLAIFIVNNNALMSAAFGGMLAFTVMVSLYYLVWRYLR